jgi:transposase
MTVRAETRSWRNRWGSVSSPRHDTAGTEPIDVASVPSRRVSGRSQRATYHTPRRRKLTAEQEAAIRALVATKSLRSLADEFGVSHETVRKVVRGRQAAGAGRARGTMSVGA